MKTNTQSIFIVTSLLIFLLIICIFDKHFYKKNKKIIEKFDNNSYTKFNETIIPNSFKNIREKGNLQQCEKNCDDDEKCIGFTRDKVDDNKDADCNLIYNIDYCLNDNKKSFDDISLSPNVSTDYSKYNTYLKNKDSDKYNINRMKCIILNEIISLKHLKYPFDFICQKDDGTLEMSKIENNTDDSEKVKGIFKIIKGLSGSGVSFMVLKGGEEYYLINHANEENIRLKQKEDSGDFSKDASFEIDIQYSNKANLFSIRKKNGNTDLYWKVNQTNKKIIMTNIIDINIDNRNPILFEIVHPIIDTFNIIPMEVPAPTIEEDTTQLEEDLRKEKQTELEQLELEIRESQHNQNMKLMDIMLDVNKFKLMDLSMSDYLTKCNRTSSEELVQIVPS